MKTHELRKNFPELLITLTKEESLKLIESLAAQLGMRYGGGVINQPFLEKNKKGTTVRHVYIVAQDE